MKYSTTTLSLIGICAIMSAIGILYASEEVASERAMKTLLEFKKDGFINVRGERRGFLAKESSLKQRIKLFGKQEYLAIATGDDDISLISMVVKDKKGKEVARSTSEGPAASLTFAPPKKAKYYFYIEVPGKGGYYQFSLVTK